MDNSLVHRNGVVARMTRNFRVHPAVSVLGPRQCGKTTLSRLFSQNVAEVTYFDMERHQDRRLMDNAESVLLDQTGTVVIDEVQRVPELFETLRVVIDHPSCKSKYLLLGSVSPSLVKGVSESLAGRVGMIDLSGFSIEEVSWLDWKKLWSRGGFPRSLLANDDEDSMIWRDNFVTTFLERDVQQFGYSIPPEALRRFWTMLAHYHGQIWNGAEFARAIGQSENAARRILDILSSTYMVRVLYPWHQNLKKRQVKSPKIYIRDSGLLHTLLELDSARTLLSHPKVGASFEGFVIENIINSLHSRDFYIWATHAGAELDLFITVAGKRYGFEIKFSESVGTTRSMRTAITDLELEHLWIVYPGTHCYRIDQKISTLSVDKVCQLIDNLKQGQPHALTDH